MLRIQESGAKSWRIMIHGKRRPSATARTRDKAASLGLRSWNETIRLLCFIIARYAKVSSRFQLLEKYTTAFSRYRKATLVVGEVVAWGTHGKRESNHRIRT